MQLGKALLQHRQVQRAQALVIVGTVWVLGVAASAGIEIVQADHRAAAAGGAAMASAILWAEVVLPAADGPVSITICRPLDSTSSAMDSIWARY